MSITTILNLTIGESKRGKSKRVPRLWMEGEKLARAGVRIGARYSMQSRTSRRIELREAAPDYAGQVFTVSRRDRDGVLRPLIDVRSGVLREVFEQCAKVKVAIRKGVIVITASPVALAMEQRSRRLLLKLRQGVALGVGSLFHGAGVMDKALHQGLLKEGVQSFVNLAIELKSAYIDASLRNNPELWRDESVVVCSDIRDVDLRHCVPSCDLLSAGIPCTGASRAGISKNGLDFAEEHKDAGTMFFDFIEAVKALNPAIVLVENVVEYLKTASMAVIRSVLKSLGYRLHEAVLTGGDFGVLERRRRMVLVAICESLPDHFGFTSLLTSRVKEASLSEALDPLADDSSRWREYKYLAEKAVEDKKKGRGYAKRQLLTGAESSCGTIGKGYNKGRSTEPFLIHPTNPALIRLLTPAEHARVKGIPEGVFAGLPETVAHEVLGQAVVFPKIESVGREIGRVCQLLREAPLGSHSLAA